MIQSVPSVSIVTQLGHMDISTQEAEDDAEFDRRQAMDTWSAFVDGETFSRAAVRDIVFESWQRSRECGIDARSVDPARVEHGAAFAARKAANDALLVAADHTWQLLSESLIASDNVLIVADRTGTVLDVRGNEEFVRAAEQQHILPGRDWSESAGGTNAIGTALVLEQPVIVRSVEHYCAAAKIWDCAAAPIRDLADGTIVGVLDVTSVGDASDKHTLALAITAAHQVEYMLHSQALARSVQLLNWYRSVEARWHNHALVLLDDKTRLVHANDNAQAVYDESALEFELLDAQPVLSRNNSARILDVLRYEPPADLVNHASLGAWHGGLVSLAISTDISSRTRSHAQHSTECDTHHAFRRIVTATPAMFELMQQAERMARANSPILLCGETGTGKELFARAIHDCSNLADGPFVAVNCGTLSRELAASELLGHVAGAFTGASNKPRAGKFEVADGGTLFLDEIGELPLDVQVHLLRVLQDNVVVPVGGNDEHRVNVRVIAATHRDLDRDATDGRFRTDLLFRLRVLILDLPPLRARRNDIPLLIEHALHVLQSTYGLGAREVAKELLDTLVRHPWPGNVRELRALIERMYILSDRPLLTRSELPQGFSIQAEEHNSAPSAVTPRAELDAVEREVILESIVNSAYNMSTAAKLLGISRSTLYRKMKRHGIERPSTGLLGANQQRGKTE